MLATGVEDPLAERGVIVSRETVRTWVTHFGLFSLLALSVTAEPTKD